MPDVLIVGGGVIGLSLAYELANYQVRVQVIDRGLPGREASWAGAGILPPANAQTALHPYDQLRALSFELHAGWAQRLREETGLDNGFRRCGGLYLARTPGEAAALRGLSDTLHQEQIAIERLTTGQLIEREPALSSAVEAERFRAVYSVPDECQLRNPRHLQALAKACQARGVDIVPNVQANEFVIYGDRLEGIKTDAGVLRADRYCLTSGAWTQQLLAKLGISNGILPIRGQMLLFSCPKKPFAAILNEGNRYLVARDDGHVLAGSTEEEVGFDKRTTAEGIAELQAFATALVPELTPARLERSWAGLRPASFDGLPYLGPVPGLANAFVAAGHFRSGLYLAPGTAVVMGELLRGLPPRIPLAAFRLGRG